MLTVACPATAISPQERGHPAKKRRIHAQNGGSTLAAPALRGRWPHLLRCRRPPVATDEVLHDQMRGPGSAWQVVPSLQVAPVQGPLLHVTLSVSCPAGVHWLVPAWRYCHQSPDLAQHSLTLSARCPEFAFPGSSIHMIDSNLLQFMALKTW